MLGSIKVDQDTEGTRENRQKFLLSSSGVTRLEDSGLQSET